MALHISARHEQSGKEHPPAPTASLIFCSASDQPLLVLVLCWPGAVPSASRCLCAPQRTEAVADIADWPKLQLNPSPPERRSGILASSVECWQVTLLLRPSAASVQVVNAGLRGMGYRVAQWRDMRGQTACLTSYLFGSAQSAASSMHHAAVARDRRVGAVPLGLDTKHWMSV